MVVLAVVADAVALPVVVAEGMSPPLSPRLSGCPNIERSGRGGGRGGAKGPGGAKGGKKVIVEPHRHKGVFVARGGKEDLLATANLVPGESVYGEKRISVENAGKGEDAVATKTEYRVSTMSLPGRWQHISHVGDCHSLNLELTLASADLEPFVSRIAPPPDIYILT